MTTRHRSAPAIRYPLLRPGTPVLRRGPAELQVGIDSDAAVVVPGAEPALEQLLHLLDGCRSREEIDRQARRWELPTRRVSELLVELGRASLLVDGRAGAGRGSTEAPVRLVGASAVGKAVADLLAPEVGRLHLVDGEPTDPALYPTAGALASQADALQAHLRRTTPARVSVWNHWSKPDGVRLDLTVVTTAMLETDRAIPDELLRSDQPHLFVRATEEVGIVGPLVVPGATACLRCTDLFRRDRDPAWPTLLNQLVRLRACPPPVVTSWAAATAVAQVFSFLNGGRPESCGATVELSGRDHRVRWRPWPAHPGCGCGWRGTAE